MTEERRAGRPGEAAECADIGSLQPPLLGLHGNGGTDDVESTTRDVRPGKRGDGLGYPHEPEAVSAEPPRPASACLDLPGRTKRRSVRDRRVGYREGGRPAVEAASARDPRAARRAL